jgi:rhamnopyranosyl-N-acetylglucosaminyl-diphospho-decaprenol beta-1,3/1,4-galactofuranosyltransferase
MLRAEFPQVRVIRLAGNAGAAGGMHVGVREGLKRDPDWLWLMDDDGVPSPGCLAEQLRVAEREQYGICGPLLLNIEEPARLAFFPPARGLPEEADSLRREVGDDHLASDVPGLWNGVLVAAHVIRKIGLPKAEMFIWGEEHEYASRAASAGYALGVAIGASYYHPPYRMAGVWLVNATVRNLTLRKCHFCDPRSPRAWIYARNLGYNDWQYHGPGRVFARLVAGFVLFWREGGPAQAVTFTRYYLDGLTDRYTLEPSRDKIRARLDFRLSP